MVNKIVVSKKSNEFPQTFDTIWCKCECSRQGRLDTFARSRPLGARRDMSDSGRKWLEL